MFHSARIKLTVWYSLIIMLVSIAFSIVIYRVLSNELDRISRTERLRIERRFGGLGLPLPPPGDTTIISELWDPDILTETKNHLQITLVIINAAILGASAGAGYLLAGRTLRPIKDMMDEQNRFITDASHELRTPLTALKAEIEVALRDKKHSLKDSRELLVSNLEEVNNLETLSNSLMKLMQYQKNEYSLAMSTLSFPEVVQDAIKVVQPLAKAKSITIEHSGSEIKISGNKIALRELLVIFLDNAIKYSPNQSTIQITWKKNDGSLSAKIEDHGIGIGAKDLPHIFDRFYRTDASRTKNEVSGYGLGLSIAKEIVERHHGSIDVKSSENKGTVFMLQLPLTYKTKIV